MKSNINKKKLATPNFDCPSSNNDSPVYCNRFVKNINQSTEIFKLIFFALFAHPNVPHKMCHMKFDVHVHPLWSFYWFDAKWLQKEILFVSEYFVIKHDCVSVILSSGLTMVACPASLYPIFIRSEALQGYSSNMYKRCQLSLRASLRSTRGMRGRLTGQTQSRTTAWPL